MTDATIPGTVPATQPGFPRIKEPAPYFEARTTHGMCKLTDYVGKWLSDHGYANPIVAMGRSLGSASALHVASARGERVAGLIVDSGFSDALELIQRLGLRLPTGVTPEDTLIRQVEKMRAYRGPVLIIHGEADWIIPIRNAEALYAAADPAARRFFRVPGAGHNNLMMKAGKSYFDAIVAFMDP
jgi:pimeloyl-ACP methyl ester carboxylesterase